MFNLICGLYRNNKVLDFEVQIDGCPSSGVAAIDFRRKYGLPEEPSSFIKLPGRIFNSEMACRKLNKMDSNADINLELICQYGYDCSAVGDIYKQQARSLTNGYGGRLVVSPKVILHYLHFDIPNSAEMLLKDVLTYESRSKKKAEKESLKRKAVVA